MLEEKPWAMMCVKGMYEKTNACLFLFYNTSRERKLIRHTVVDFFNNLLFLCDSSSLVFVFIEAVMMTDHAKNDGAGSSVKTESRTHGVVCNVLT